MMNTKTIVAGSNCSICRLSCTSAITSTDEESVVATNMFEFISSIGVVVSIAIKGELAF